MTPPIILRTVSNIDTDTVHLFPYLYPYTSYSLSTKLLFHSTEIHQHPPLFDEFNMYDILNKKTQDTVNRMIADSYCQTNSSSSNYDTHTDLSNKCRDKYLEMITDSHNNVETSVDISGQKEMTQQVTTNNRYGCIVC